VVHLRAAASSDAALLLVRKCLDYSTPRPCRKPYGYPAVGEAVHRPDFGGLDLLARFHKVSSMYDSI
jgi:hypothetical protein